MGTRTKKLHSNADNFLNLESTRTTTSTSLLELASLGSDIWLDSIVGVLVVDGGSVSEVGKSSTALWSTEKDGVGSGWCAKCELIESEALSSSSNNTLACVLGESKSAYGKLWYLHHTNIVGYLSYDNSDLSFLVLHVVSKAVKSDRWSINSGHMKTLYNSCAELGVGTTCKELVQLDEKTVVRVCTLDYLGRGLVSSTASTCFQIDSHVCKIMLKSERIKRHVRKE